MRWRSLSPLVALLLATSRIAVLAAAIPLAEDVNGTNTIVNPGFETGDSDPWVCTPANDTFDCGVDLAGGGVRFPQEGTHNSYIRGAASITQNVSYLVEGATYSLQWWAYEIIIPPLAGNVQVGLTNGTSPMLWGDSRAMVFTVANGTEAAGPYGFYSSNVTAPATNAWLTFLYSAEAGSSSAMRLDNVSLTMVGLPPAAPKTKSTISPVVVAGAAVGAAAGAALITVALMLLFASMRRRRSYDRREKQGMTLATPPPMLVPVDLTNHGSSNHPAGAPPSYRPSSKPPAVQNTTSEHGTAGNSSGAHGPRWGPPQPHQQQQDLRLFARSPDVYQPFGIFPGQQVPVR